MTDVDTADALLFDDDGDDCDVGQDEEAELLREDDDDEVHIDYQVDPLEEEEEEDSHRDKFASERTQHHITVNEGNHNKMYNRENHHQRFNGFNNRGHGGGRGRGRGCYSNGPGRKGALCFVNPSFLQGVKKPVQSVQPWLNQPRTYEPERRVTAVPFGGHRFQQQQQQQNQCQPQFNQTMQMNNQSYGSSMNQHNWQASQQQSHPQTQQNYYDGATSQQQYQPPIHQNQQNPSQYPQQQQFPNQPQQFGYDTQQNQNFYLNQSNTQSSFNCDPNFNQYQAPQAQFHSQHAQHQQNMQPSTPFNQSHNQVQAQQHSQHMPQHQQPTQHAPHYMQQSQQMPQQNNFYEQYPQQNQSLNQNYTPAQSNQSNHTPASGPSFNPPQRHSGPLLQRPLLHFAHDRGSFHPRARFQHQHPRPLFTPRPNQNYQNQNPQFRPRMQTRPNYRHQFGQSQRGSYDGGHNFNQRHLTTFKRRNDWQEQTEQEYPKRTTWTNYNEQQGHKQENYDEYNEEYNEAEEHQEEDTQEFKPKVTATKDTTPDVEEDDETKAYRRMIDEQKRKREEYLAEKERKRKLEILKKTGEVCDIPALQTSPPAPAARPRIIPARLTSNTNPNLRVLTRTDGEKIELMSGTVTKVKIQPGVAPKPADDKLTSGFLASRKVIAQDESLLDTKVVVVSNLANSSEPQLRKMCHGVGLVQSLEMSPKERHAKIRFKSVASAHAFYKKYQRHMLDLSMIQVELVPDTITEK